MLRLVFALLLTVTAEVATACSCMPRVDVAGEFERSALVVDATVISIDDPWSGPKLADWLRSPFGEPMPGSASDALAVTLEVHELWKGPMARRLVVRTAQLGSACGFRFEVGSRYVIYAGSLAAPEYVTAWCTRTRLREDEEVAALKVLAKSSRF